jgi:hypothetical protein
MTQTTTTDTNIGRRVLRGETGIAGRIIGRTGNVYSIRWADGLTGTVTDADLKAADAVSTKEAATRAASYDRGAAARKTLADLDALRNERNLSAYFTRKVAFGETTEALTEADKAKNKAKILRMSRGEPEPTASKTGTSVTRPTSTSHFQTDADRQTSVNAHVEALLKGKSNG